MFAVVYKKVDQWEANIGFHTYLEALQFAEEVFGDGYEWLIAKQVPVEFT